MVVLHAMETPGNTSFATTTIARQIASGATGVTSGYVIARVVVDGKSVCGTSANKLRLAA
jgi:hypothetical protein